MTDSPPRLSIAAIGLAASLGGTVFGGGIAWEALKAANTATSTAQATSDKATADKLALLGSTDDLRTANLTARLDLLAASTNARFESIDRRDEVRNDRVGTIDNRLNRIEAQLAFLVQTASAKR